jgi:hypothetical protein
LIKFIKKFKNINEDKLNLPLIKRELEGDLVEFVIEVFRSLETIPFIKFLDYDIQYDESEINFAKYITSRKKKKKREKHIKYHYIKPDRAYELTMRFLITVKGEQKIIKKSILIPKKDKNNYLTLKGKSFFLLYQLLDSSTYVVKNGLTLKSLMPIIINFRDKDMALEDIHGNMYKFATYYMKVFKRDISVMIFYFCKMGFYTTLRYFLLDNIIFMVKPSEVNEDDTEYLYFPVNKHFTMKVNKHFFDKYDFIKAVTGMIFECFGSKTTPMTIDNKNYWLEKLGSLYTTTKHKKIESGLSTMLFFERLLDLTTKKTLKVSEINKTSIYSVIKWMISNFPDLRSKNNMDLNTKRLRLNE